MNSCVSHDVFISVNNVLRRYNEIKKKSKIYKILWNTLYNNNGNVLC